ncbi:MAG: dTDP-4-dehydrorhamnose 3,5-epimerase [Planctomycetia bacterium]|nr:dTDP-4-dehydrorhamnose 3,5-epimerase [Planctomycetia bacterium]
MNIIPTTIPEVLLLEPAVFRDARGFFLESYNERSFASLGITAHFVQDNHSRSSRGVLRGLHYQIQQAQGKLVRVVRGEVYDVAVDIRRHSPTFGRWVGFHLSDTNLRIAYVPPGFAHGFVVLSETVEFLYKTTDYYAREFERAILFNDPDIGISWPDAGALVLSEKDRRAPRLRDAEVYP